LGTVVGRSNDPGRHSLSSQLFQVALPAVASFTSPRAWAFALLAIEDYLRAFEGDSSVAALATILVEKLLDIFRRTSQANWVWFEDGLTYCNARLSQALLASAARTRHEEARSVGLRSLEWLASVEYSEEGYFAPVGSNGFHPRTGTRAAFDQQPVEACAMVSACMEAHRLTRDERWARRARSSFSWFLGQNQLQQPLYDPNTGGCRDGLHHDRANENQGAESTLSFLLALCEMRSVDRVDLARLAQEETLS